MSSRNSSVLAIGVVAAFAGGCVPAVQPSMRPYVAVPPAPPQNEFCQLNVISGALPTPQPGVVVPVAHLECRYQAVTDQGTCRRELQKMACQNGANTLGGIQESMGFIAAEAIFMAPQPAAPPPAAPPPMVATGPQPGDPLPPEGAGPPPGAPLPGQPLPGAPVAAPPAMAPATAAPPPMPGAPLPGQPLPGAPATAAPPAQTAAPGPPPPPPIPETLGRADVAAGMEGVRSQVLECMRGGNITTTVNVSVEIAGTGRVNNATVEGGPAGTPPGACIEAVVLGAQFRAFSGRNITVRYPYRP
jgi:hypothetical protein